MKPCVSEQLQYYNLLTSEIDEAYHNASLKLGLSDSAMMILYALCSRENPCPLLEIARLTGISRQTIHVGYKKAGGPGDPDPGKPWAQEKAGPPDRGGNGAGRKDGRPSYKDRK